jgi:hypothetical protein
MKKTHKTSIIIAFIIALNTVSYAQDSLTKNHLILKIAPLTIFDFDNTFEFAVEHRLGKQNRWTLSEQLGYGAGVANVWEENFGNSREHFRAKMEARRYKKANGEMAGFYTAYELIFKQVNDNISRSVGRECESGPCTYFEDLNYPVSKYVVGTTAKIGYQHRFKDGNNKNTKFMFDFYVGLGLRRVMIDHKIDGAAIQNNSWFFNEAWFGGFGYADRAYNIPHGSFGIRFGYLVF